RRPQGHRRQRLVCRAALGHGRHLQDLRRKLQGRGPSRDASRRSATYRQQGTVAVMKATERLYRSGQSLWLDNITRGLLTSGTLARYIRELAVKGLTSNPTIFDHAIKQGDAYDGAIRELLEAGFSGERLFFELALQDLTAAADLFRELHEQTAGVDGWVSLEVSPLLAHDTHLTLAAAKELH